MFGSGYCSQAHVVSLCSGLGPISGFLLPSILSDKTPDYDGWDRESRRGLMSAIPSSLTKFGARLIIMVQLLVAVRTWLEG